jgi:hypothetical protein
MGRLNGEHDDVILANARHSQPVRKFLARCGLRATEKGKNLSKMSQKEQNK